VGGDSDVAYFVEVRRHGSSSGLAGRCCVLLCCSSGSVRAPDLLSRRLLRLITRNTDTRGWSTWWVDDSKRHSIWSGVLLGLPTPPVRWARGGRKIVSRRRPQARPSGRFSASGRPHHRWARESSFPVGGRL